MEEYKFKKGDRVKVIYLRNNTHHRDSIAIGMEGTVIEDFSDRPWIEFDENINGDNTYEGSEREKTMCMWENEIELIEDFNIGDKVKINKNATIEDFSKNDWNGCQLHTLDFIKAYANKDIIFELVEVEDEYCMLKNERRLVNKNILKLVERKKEILELTLEDIAKKYETDVKNIKIID